MGEGRMKNIACLLTGDGPEEENICPKGGTHHPLPSGYIQRYEWTMRMKKTHVQKKCPACGLGFVWELKE